jgi:ribulose-bisphosphate carboxylase large chain
MRLARVAELVRFYGRDTLLLIGGDLHGQGEDLVASCRRFRALAEGCASADPPPPADR